MSLSIQPLRREDGVHALVEGYGGTFRFRLGMGNIGIINHPSAYMWSVDGPVGSYVLQVIPHTFTLTPGAKPMDVLASHYRWETDFMREKLGVTVEEPGPGVLTHPSGSPMLVWLTRRPDDGNIDSDPDGKATQLTAHATLLHAIDRLLHFSATGMGPGWNEHDLRTQVLRASFSYFPLDGPDTPNDPQWESTQ